MAGKRIHSLSSILYFGKYKGLKVEAVLRFNARYFLWVTKNVDGFSLDGEAHAAMIKAARKEWNASMDRQNAWAWGFGREVRVEADRAAMRRIEVEQEERKKAGQWLNDDLEWVGPDPLYRAEGNA